MKPTRLRLSSESIQAIILHQRNDSSLGEKTSALDALARITQDIDRRWAESNKAGNALDFPLQVLALSLRGGPRRPRFVAFPFQGTCIGW
jgi:hypothetical protein